jgi:hypothetical protein
MENRARPKPLTAKDFFQLDECHCGKNLFRYHNVSKNEYIAKCNTAREEYDLKSRHWTISKKQPCDFFYAYYAERPVFKDIKNTTKKTKQLKINKDKLLEEKLKSLFNFVFISNHTCTLDEINITVKLNLRREPLKSDETLKEYQARIFSEKIVDLGHLQDLPEPHEPVVYFSHAFLDRNKTVKKKSKIIKTKSSFIVVSDEDSFENAHGDESEQETSSCRELSDYEDIEEIEQQTDHEETFEENEEPADDYDDAGDFSDYD